LRATLFAVKVVWALYIIPLMDITLLWGNWFSYDQVRWNTKTGMQPANHFQGYIL
jgi:hypothetical protein